MLPHLQDQQMVVLTLIVLLQFTVKNTLQNHLLVSREGKTFPTSRADLCSLSRLPTPEASGEKQKLVNGKLFTQLPGIYDTGSDLTHISPQLTKQVNFQPKRSKTYKTVTIHGTK